MNRNITKKIEPEDRLALFGYGLFETLRVGSQGLEVPYLHYERLKKGAQILNLELLEYSVWLEELLQIVEEQKTSAPYGIRMTLSGGSPMQGLPSQTFYQTRTIPYTEQAYHEGVKVCFLEVPRNERSKLVQIKSTNYLENLLAKQEAQERGALEGICLNSQGYVAEGSMSNLFFVRDGILYTPSLNSGCLPGTRRFIVLECARSLGIPCQEGDFLPGFLEQAQEIFLTNALMGILPVKQIENWPILTHFQSPNSLTAHLSKAYTAYLQSHSQRS